MSDLAWTEADLSDLPGAELVLPGLADAWAGASTISALLVAIAARRLRAAGVDVPPDDRLPVDPEGALYRLLSAEVGREAHGRYLALTRRLVSFERGVEARATRRRQA